MPRRPRFLANEAHEDFYFLTVTQLMMAWTAYREGHISLKDLRAYFALTEMKSRRSEAKDEAPPEFSHRAVRELIGGTKGERSPVRKLLGVGLIRALSKSAIEFASDPSELRFQPETLEAGLGCISKKQKLVAVPRPILRFIASGAHRTLIATILGHLIRCLKWGAPQPKGCVKASWIAKVFGISERRVYEQRQHLVALGWLIPQGMSQQLLNLHGLSLVVNLGWDGPSIAEYRRTKQPFTQPTAPASMTAVPRAESVEHLTAAQVAP